MPCITTAQLNDAVLKLTSVLEAMTKDETPCEDLRRDKFEKMMCAGMSLSIKMMTYCIAEVQKAKKGKNKVDILLPGDSPVGDN